MMSILYTVIAILAVIMIVKLVLPRKPSKPEKISTYTQEEFDREEAAKQKAENDAKEASVKEAAEKMKEYEERLSSIKSGNEDKPFAKINTLSIEDLPDELIHPKEEKPKPKKRTRKKKGDTQNDN